MKKNTVDASLAHAPHLVVLMRKSRVAEWRLNIRGVDRTGNAKISFESNAAPFRKHARPGGVLWVLGSYENNAVSLEATIRIRHRRDDSDSPPGFRTTIEGSARDSRVFARNDASSAVMPLVFEGRSRTWSLPGKQWRSAYGAKFMQPRILAAKPGPAPLRRLAARLPERSIFISWKHCDCNRSVERFIGHLGDELIRNGFEVWWDRFIQGSRAIQSEYERRRLVPELIRQGLHGRKVILGLWTHNYGSVTRRRKSWSWKEWEERGHGEHRLRVALIPDRSTMDCCIRLTRPDVVLTIPSLEWLKSARAEKSRDAASTIARHLVVSPQVRLRVGLPPI